MISQKTFCNAFPFHIIFDKNMYIKQSGASISRVIPKIKISKIKLTEIFEITRPHINLDFQSICSQIMSVFVLSTKEGILDLDKMNDTQIEKTNCTRFKGQMVYLKDRELILFQCSPSVMSIDDLFT
jgi:guanylate cyclase soluble subunit beta